MTSPLTVALCTYNPRRDLLARAVRAVVSQLQDVPGADFLIVDNNSNPPLEDAAELRGLPVAIVGEPVQGLTAAKAAAIRHAAGDAVLFVDDDNVLDAGYLAKVVAAFGDPKLGVLGGRVVPEYEGRPPAWLSRFETQLAIRRYPADLVVETAGLPYTDYFPVGAGCAVRRSLALAYLEDADVRGRIEGRRGNALSSGEDLDFDLFALHRGCTLKAMGSLSLTHVIPSARCTEAYMSRLVVANLRSVDEIDRKWSATFGAPIFSFLHVGPSRARLRWAFFDLLAPVSTTARIKRAIWLEIRRLLEARSTQKGR